MALFRKKAKTTPSAATGVTSLASFPRADVAATVLIAPRITEKATSVTERGVYVFNVHRGATKSDVARAIEQLYRVKPRKVHMVNIPSKTKLTRNQRTSGSTASGRKAYVYLKKGETIEIA